MSDENSQPQPFVKEKAAASTARLALWLSFLAFLLIVLVFHGRLSEIEFGEKGVSAKMGNPEDTSKLSPEQKKAADQDLSQRLSQLEQQAKARPHSAPVMEPAPSSEDASEFTNAGFQQPQAQPVALNLGGYWMGGSPGYTFQVMHNGNYIIINSFYNGVRNAVAGGPILGPSFTIQSLDIWNHPGALALQVSPNQREMTGTYRDNITGQSFPVEMSR